MTLSLYPGDDDPSAQPTPPKRPLALRWAGGASAAIVVLASASWLVFGDHGSGGGDRLALPPSASDSGGPSPGQGSPAGTSAAGPAPSGPAASGGPGTPAPDLPVSYRVATDLCPSVDFSPLSGLPGTASGPAAGDQKDYGESGYTDYSCLQRYAQGSANAQAEIFGNPAGAGAWYDTTRGNSVAPTDVPGVGTAAFDYLLPGDHIETYHLWVRDANLAFGVTVQVKGGKLPGPNTLRASAVNVARAALPKLRA